MTIYKSKSIINFGKHKDETVEDVLLIDPEYLVWASENIEWFELDEKIKEKAVDSVFQKTVGRYVRKNMSYQPDGFDEYFEGDYDPF